LRPSASASLKFSSKVDFTSGLVRSFSICAQVRAEGRTDDGPAWAASASCLGTGVLDEARAAFREEGDSEPLLETAREAAGEAAVERALAAHKRRLR